MWYVQGVQESEARGGRGMGLARGASRERSHLRLTTLLIGFGWPATDTVKAGSLALGIGQVFQDKGEQGGS